MERGPGEQKVQEHFELSNLKSLVADYDSSSGDEKEDVSKSVSLVPALKMLNDSLKSVSSSVFTNPYRQAENYEQSILERHVKMTVLKEKEEEKKRKVCYKFQKGKCKFGAECKFMHHNPMQVFEEGKDCIDHEESNRTTPKKDAKKRCGLKDDLIPPKKYMKTFHKQKK